MTARGLAPGPTGRGPDTVARPRRRLTGFPYRHNNCRRRYGRALTGVNRSARWAPGSVGGRGYLRRMSEDASAALVDGVPVVWVTPAARSATPPLALWLPALSRSTADAVPFLHELAGAGFVAVSLDPWQHGARGTESGEELLSRVFG